MIGSAFLLATGSLERSFEYECFTDHRKVEQKIGIINRKYHRRYNLWKKKQWEL